MRRHGAPVRVALPDTAAGGRQLFLLDVLPGGRTALVGQGTGTGFTSRDGRFVMVRRTQVPKIVLIQNVYALVHTARDK